MAIRVFQLVLSATPKRLSDVYGGTPGTPDESKNIPYRQLFLQADGADFVVGDSTVTTTNYGAKFPVTGNAFASGSLGPYETGPLKLSDFWAVGAGATVHIVGVPF